MEPKASPCSSLKRGRNEGSPICKSITMELLLLLYAKTINDSPIYDLFTVMAPSVFWLRVWFLLCACHLCEFILSLFHFQVRPLSILVNLSIYSVILRPASPVVPPFRFWIVCPAVKAAALWQLLLNNDRPDDLNCPTWYIPCCRWSLGCRFCPLLSVEEGIDISACTVFTT